MGTVSATMTRSAARRQPQGTDELSHNLVGQKLGRKGAETRERAVAAMLRLLDDPRGPPVTLTRVAREASVGMTSLYLYFPDLGDLLLAALRRVGETEGEAFAALIRDYWPDEMLEACCLRFGQAQVGFWRRHARLMHMRNAFADSFNLRVLAYRQQASLPLIDMLVRQMGGPAGRTDKACFRFATVVMTGMERMATVVTNPHFHITAEELGEADVEGYAQQLIEVEADLVALAIRDQRRRSRAAGQQAGAGSSAARRA